MVIDHVGRHHGVQAGAHQARERHQVVAFDLGVVAMVDRDLVVRIASHETMPGEMLAAGDHTASRQPLDQRGSQLGDHLRVAVEAAIADHRADAMIEVEHRREAQVDAAGTQLGRQHFTDGACGVTRLIRRARPHLAQHAHRRQAGKPVQEALDAPPFVVDRDQQVRAAQRTNLVGQRTQLCDRFEVAPEQDHRADQRVGQAVLFFVGQADAGDVDHHRAARQLQGHDRVQVD